MRFNSNLYLPTGTLIEFRMLTIFINCIIEKDNEYYPEIYLDECFYVNDDYLKEYIMVIRSLKIKNVSYYFSNDIIYLNKFDNSMLKINKRENRENNNIYYISYVINKSISISLIICILLFKIYIAL